jgi:hypothetical protein
MARKGWDQLSTNYRSRLERKGVGKTAYESGASLQQARGHKSAGHESTRRIINDFIRRMELYYGRDPDDTREALAEYSTAQVAAGVRRQRDSERAYDRGHMQLAKDLWEQRDQSLPDWMFFYHGAFS